MIVAIRETKWKRERKKETRISLNGFLKAKNTFTMSAKHRIMQWITIKQSVAESNKMCKRKK